MISAQWKRTKFLTFYYILTHIFLGIPVHTHASTHTSEDFAVSRFGAAPAIPDHGYATPPTVSFIDQAPTEIIPEPALGIHEVALIVDDSGFSPEVITTSLGQPLKIFVTGASKKTLCIMIDDFQIKKEIHSQKVEEIQFTPKKEGFIRFYCPINGVEGKILVKEYQKQEN